MGVFIFLAAIGLICLILWGAAKLGIKPNQTYTWGPKGSTGGGNQNARRQADKREESADAADVTEKTQHMGPGNH